MPPKIHSNFAFINPFVAAMRQHISFAFLVSIVRINAFDCNPIIADILESRNITEFNKTKINCSLHGSQAQIFTLQNDKDNAKKQKLR